MKKRAFSLIELMVAVSVLAIGIVLIGRSFLSASSALTNGQNRITALNFLESKMGDIEEQALKGYDKDLSAQESVVIDSKTFIYKTNYDKVPFGTGEGNQTINKVTVTAAWSEGSKGYDEIFSTYFNTEKKE